MDHINEKAQIALMRAIDPQRGAFDPVEKLPPNHVRHPDKTAQDHMPRDQRPRVQEAQRRAAR